MAKVYTKITWVDEILAAAARFLIRTDAGATLYATTQITLETSVVTPGTDVNATNMNHLETGLDTLDQKFVDVLEGITTGGTSTAYTVTTVLALALATNERFRVKFHTAAGATPTLNRDSKGAKSLKFYGANGGKQAVTSSQVFTNMQADIFYDGTDYVLLTVAAVRMIDINADQINISGQAAATLPMDRTSDYLLGYDNGSGSASKITPKDLANTLMYQGADIAAAGTTNIGAGTGLNINITGSTTITAFDSVDIGRVRKLKFTGAPLLTHNATSLILPGGKSIQIVAGDTAEFVSLGSGNWKCFSFTPGSYLNHSTNALARTDGRILRSPLSTDNNGKLLISGTAYFVYLGQTLIDMTPKFVEFSVTAAGVGTQTAECGFFSSPIAPNKSASQSLTKLVATATVDSMLTTGIKRNTSAFATSVPAGTHLWAGIRTAMVTTQPTIHSTLNDMNQGAILSLVGSGVLTGAGPFTGSVIAFTNGLECPYLVGTLD